MNNNICKNKYEYLFFDLDGTLLDFDKDHEKAFNLAAKKLNIKINGAYKIYDKINSMLWNKHALGEIEIKELKLKRFQMFFEEINCESDPAQFKSLMTSEMKNTGFPIKDAKHVLKKLCKKYKIYAITNGIEEEQNHRLKNAKIDCYFSDVFISQTLGVDKPQKEFFDKVLNAINLSSTENILIIGDSLKSDILGGINSGIDTCWFNLKNERNDSDIKPTYEVGCLKEVLKLLGEK